jgi:hypothetical protein
MVQVLLAGRKTQTRRAINQQPTINSCQQKYTEHVEAMAIALFKQDVQCPHGASGNLLWVRETFCPIGDRPFGGLQWIDYRATPKCEDSHPAGWENAPDDAQALKWRPSIFMPRHASRLTLEITNVHVQRLDELTDADAIAEGLATITKDGHLYKYGIPDRDGSPGADNDGWPWDEWSPSPRGAYFRLWDKIRGPLACADNPWKWVLQFTVHQVNIDAFIEAKEAAAA